MAEHEHPAVTNFRNYLRIPSVQPNVNYGLYEFVISYFHNHFLKNVQKIREMLQTNVFRFYRTWPTN